MRRSLPFPLPRGEGRGEGVKGAMTFWEGLTLTGVGATLFGLIVGVFSVYNGRMTRREITRVIVEEAQATRALILEESRATRAMLEELRTLLGELRAILDRITAVLEANTAILTKLEARLKP